MTRYHGRWIISLILLFLSISLYAQPAKLAYQINIDGGIGPASQAYVKRGLTLAQKNQASLVILQIDTPGGLMKSMRAMIKDMLASPVPIVAYVAPSGSHAASAGTFLVYAAQIAAMAPGTNLGAAAPVAMGMPNILDKKKDGQKDTMMTKTTEDAVAYIQSLAELHGRNAKWAKLAVTQAVSLSAKQALKKKVINVIAPNTESLLKKIDGYKVSVLGEKQTLNTQGLMIKLVTPNFRDQVLAIVASPTIAYLLLLVGIYGIMFELMNPGMIFPGVIGVVALIISIYGLHLLPVSLVGIALIIVGILFMILEAFVTSFGVLALLGVIAFFIGSVMLFDRNVPGFHITLWVIIGLTAVTAAFFLIVIRMAMKSFKHPVVSGAEQLIGMHGVVVTCGEKNTARIHSEMWAVKSEEALKVGQKVVVTKRKGLILTVKGES